MRTFINFTKNEFATEICADVLTSGEFLAIVQTAFQKSTREKWNTESRNYFVSFYALIVLFKMSLNPYYFQEYTPEVRGKESCSNLHLQR